MEIKIYIAPFILFYLSKYISRTLTTHWNDFSSSTRLLTFVAFIHHIDIYKVTDIFIIIIKNIILIYYCSFVYPVAVGVLARAPIGRCGRAIQNNDWVIVP